MFNNRKTVSKTVFSTVCTGVRVSNETGDIEKCNFVLYGRYDNDRATKQIRKLEKNNSIIITNTEIIRDYYTMDLQKFISLASKKN